MSRKSVHIYRPVPDIPRDQPMELTASGAMMMPMPVFGHEPEIREVAYMMPDDWHPLDEMDRELGRDYGK